MVSGRVRKMHANSNLISKQLGDFINEVLQRLLWINLLWTSVMFCAVKMGSGVTACYWQGRLKCLRHEELLQHLQARKGPGSQGH